MCPCAGRSAGSTRCLIGVRTRRCKGSVPRLVSTLDPVATSDDVRAQLARVQLSGFARDIVAFGLVRDVAVRDGHVTVDLDAARAKSRRSSRRCARNRGGGRDACRGDRRRDPLATAVEPKAPRPSRRASPAARASREHPRRRERKGRRREIDGRREPRARAQGAGPPGRAARRRRPRPERAADDRALRSAAPHARGEEDRSASSASGSRSYRWGSSSTTARRSSGAGRWS